MPVCGACRVIAEPRPARAERISAALSPSTSRRCRAAPRNAFASTDCAPCKAWYSASALFHCGASNSANGSPAVTRVYGARTCSRLMTASTRALIVLASRRSQVTVPGTVTVRDSVRRSTSGVGSNAGNLMATYEYGKYSTRGKSELTFNAENKTSGLDKDYATQWSYGKGETMSLLIPS